MWLGACECLCRRGPLPAPTGSALACPLQAGVGWTGQAALGSPLSILLASALGTYEPCIHLIMERVGSGHQPLR